MAETVGRVVGIAATRGKNTHPVNFEKDKRDKTKERRGAPEGSGAHGEDASLKRHRQSDGIDGENQPSPDPKHQQVRLIEMPETGVVSHRATSTPDPPNACNLRITDWTLSGSLIRQNVQNTLDVTGDHTMAQPYIYYTILQYNPKHSNSVYKKMFSYVRTLQPQCLAVLYRHSRADPARRVILKDQGAYFNEKFFGFEESRQDRIVLQDIDGNALQLLIDYVYTAEVLVTEDNVQVLLPAANLLQLTDVRDACCEFLQSQLHPTNCLGIRAFADLHGCLELLSIAESYVEQHFTEVVECEEFLSLTSQQVIKLISSDRLTTPSEEKVFECVMSWVGAELSSREQQLAELMEYVRLPLLSQDYLIQRVEEEPLLKHDTQCKDYLIEAMKFHLLKGEQKALFKSPRTKPRQPVGLPKVLLVVGGQAPKAIRSVECYDFKDERWFPVAEMPTRRCRCGIAVINSKVYAVGGFNGSLRVRTVDMYDPARDAWSSCASMEARRSTLGVATLNGCIYAVGGFDGSTGLNSAEMYDSKTFEWRMIAPMSTRRSSVGVGVVNGFLYAVGGYDGASRQCLASVEKYCPESDVWTSVAEMSARRSGAGVANLYSRLYSFLASFGNMCHESLEVFKIWRPKASRYNLSPISQNGLYLIGGGDGATNLQLTISHKHHTISWWSLLIH
ncbi:unnamed protein product, partial [Meganyctiphanes norvegica]